MGFLSGYTGDMGHGSYGMDGMFGGGGGTFSATGGGFGTFGGPTAAAGFNYFHGKCSLLKIMAIRSNVFNFKVFGKLIILVSVTLAVFAFIL